MDYTMRRLLFITLSLVFIISYVSSHTYHLGSCPVVTPQPNFEMENMLGKWYVIRKTSTSSKCLVYNFIKTDEPYQYKIEQVSDHPVLGLLSVDNKYHYTGVLTVPHRAVKADMIVRFPLSVAGSASFTVFDTDYRNYAAIFTCQKLPLSHRQSVSVLSRTKTIDATSLEEIRSKLDSFGISPYDLSIIEQSGCKADTEGVQINIDDQTLSSKNIGDVVRKAGEKIGDGVETVLDGTKKVYNTATNRNNNYEHNDKREELIENQQQNEVEWLP